MGLHNTSEIKSTHELTPVADIAGAEIVAHLRMFMLRVQRIFPACKFALIHRNLVDVYHEHKPMSMGRLGYGNYNPDVFEVFSPRIENCKYAKFSNRYTMKHTKNIEVGERNVKKFIRDLSPSELAEIFTSEARANWGETVAAMETDARADYNVLLHDTPKMLTELQAIVNSGHEFIDAEFGQKVSRLLSLHEEKARTTRERSSCMAMVSIEETTAGAKFVMVENENVNPRYPASTPPWVPKGVFVEETLQANYPDIFGKLSMLQMCEIDQWVDGVGFRATPTVYYVVR